MDRIFWLRHIYSMFQNKLESVRSLALPAHNTNMEKGGRKTSAEKMCPVWAFSQVALNNFHCWGWEKELQQQNSFQLFLQHFKLTRDTSKKFGWPNQQSKKLRCKTGPRFATGWKLLIWETVLRTPNHWFSKNSHPLGLQWVTGKRWLHSQCCSGCCSSCKARLLLLAIFCCDHL